MRKDGREHRLVADNRHRLGRGNLLAGDDDLLDALARQGLSVRGSIRRNARAAISAVALPEARGS